MVNKKQTDRNSSWLPKLQGSASEQKARAAEDAATRRAAGESPKSIILTAKDLQGEYDIARTLITTMGGMVRNITHDDLAAFRHNVRIVQNRYKGGIRARQVLELSLPDDRERANREIKRCVPVSANGGKVRFMTNAGPDSKVTHHHVIVDFLSYASAASGARDTIKKSVQWMCREPLRIECDCERWRYWYRYIATIGKFNAGRDETGYPKIRNPNLSGVACKHILRVMAEVESSPSIHQFLARLIGKARARDDNRVSVQMSQKEADKMAAKPASRIRDVETTMRQRQRARERAAIARAAKKAVPPPPKRRATATRRAVNASARTLAAQFGMTPEQVMKLLAQAQQNQKG